MGHSEWRGAKDAETVPLSACNFSVTAFTCNFQSVANIFHLTLMSEYLRARLILKVVTLKLFHIFKKKNFQIMHPVVLVYKKRKKQLTIKYNFVQ